MTGNAALGRATQKLLQTGIDAGAKKFGVDGEGVRRMRGHKLAGRPRDARGRLLPMQSGVRHVRLAAAKKGKGFLGDVLGFGAHPRRGAYPMSHHGSGLYL